MGWVSRFLYYLLILSFPIKGRDAEACSLPWKFQIRNSHLIVYWFLTFVMIRYFQLVGIGQPGCENPLVSSRLSITTEKQYAGFCLMWAGCRSNKFYSFGYGMNTPELLLTTASQHPARTSFQRCEHSFNIKRRMCVWWIILNFYS